MALPKRAPAAKRARTNCTEQVWHAAYKQNKHGSVAMLEQYLVTSQHKQTAYVPLLDPCTLKRESQLKAVGQMAAKNARKHASIQRHALLQHERTVNINVHIPAILRRHAHAKESPCSCNACKSSQVRAKKMPCTLPMQQALPAR